MCICGVLLMGVLCVNSRSTKMNEKLGDKEVGLCDTALHRTDLVDVPTDTRNQADEGAGGVKRRPVKLLLQRHSLLKYRTYKH